MRSGLVSCNHERSRRIAAASSCGLSAGVGRPYVSRTPQAGRVPRPSDQRPLVTTDGSLPRWHSPTPCCSTWTEPWSTPSRTGSTPSTSWPPPTAPLDPRRRHVDRRHGAARRRRRAPGRHRHERARDRGAHGRRGVRPARPLHPVAAGAPGTCSPSWRRPAPAAWSRCPTGRSPTASWPTPAGRFRRRRHGRHGQPGQAPPRAVPHGRRQAGRRPRPGPWRSRTPHRPGLGHPPRAPALAVPISCRSRRRPASTRRQPGRRHPADLATIAAGTPSTRLAGRGGGVGKC